MASPVCSPVLLVKSEISTKTGVSASSGVKSFLSFARGSTLDLPLLWSELQRISQSYVSLLPLATHTKVDPLKHLRVYMLNSKDRSTWRATTFTSIEHILKLDKLVARVALQAVYRDCFAKQLNPEVSVMQAAKSVRWNNRTERKRCLRLKID
jgi:hypothetical protein